MLVKLTANQLKKNGRMKPEHIKRTILWKSRRCPPLFKKWEIFSHSGFLQTILPIKKPLNPRKQTSISTTAALRKYFVFGSIIGN